MQKWNTLKSEYLHKSPFGNIRKDICKLPNGLVIDEYYVNEYADWVNAIVITKENQIVLVEQYRYAGNDFFLEIPAGKREGNESHEEGLIREVREETGYISLTNPILLGEFMVNPATQNNRVKTYLIVNAFRKYEQQLDDTEQINVKLIDFVEMANLIWTNEIKTQLFTVSAYFMAKDYLGERRK